MHRPHPLDRLLHRRVRAELVTLFDRYADAASGGLPTTAPAAYVEWLQSVDRDLAAGHPVDRASVRAGLLSRDPPSSWSRPQPRRKGNALRLRQ